MLKQSDAFNRAFASDDRVLTVKATVGDRSFTADDMVSVEYNSAAMTGEQMGIGSTFENSVKISFANLVEGIKAQDKVTVSIGIQLPDKSFEYAPLGVFYVDGEITMDRNNQLTSITAVDGMCWLEGMYSPKVIVPTTLSAMALDIANQAGVPINQSNFAKLPNITIKSLPNGKTYRVALGLLAMLIPGFSSFDRNGQLCLRDINQNNYQVEPSNYEFQGLTKNENAYTISGITVNPLTETTDYSATNTEVTGSDTATSNTTLHVGKTSGSQLVLQSDFIDDRILNNIWGALQEIQYFPYTLNWFGNPAVEAGDWLTVFDTKGNQFIIPNNSYTLTFSGGLSAVSSTGETVTSPTNWDYHGSLTQTIKDITERLNSTGTYTYYTPTTPATAHEGDLWYKTGSTSTSLYIYSNGQWMLVVSDLTGAQIEQKINAAQNDIISARKIADEANELASTNANALQSKIGTDEYNSKISQLTNDINLRVTKGNVISQLNVEAGQTLIQSGKILLDAPSVIFSGSAFIPDAAIKNLSASKLSAGILDANVVNVINMNANNITAGILSGKNLSLNLETGEVEFQSGNIKNASNKFNIDIDKGTVTSVGESGSVVTLTNGGLNYFKNSTDTEMAGQVGLGWHTLNTDIPNLVFQSVGKIVLAVENPIVTSGTLNIDEVSSLSISKDTFESNLEYGFTTSKASVFHPNIHFEKSGFSVATYPYYSSVIDSEGNAPISLTVYKGDGITDFAGITISNGTQAGPIVDIVGKASITGATKVYGDTLLMGKLGTLGAKNAIHVTRDGVRATPAYETAESYLGDIGEAATDDTGKAIVPIEALFGDTVNTAIAYQVFLQSYSINHVWVSSRDETFFTVQSDQPNAPFVWEIKAKRRGYEKDRLVKSAVDVKEIAKAEGYKDE
ncbi:hypothetical protein [Levilactobacillus enshiensis]|uniref:hypothetical protein n=1 Tax=Levilactobacillus enshiensis TaxID=2590213 RepID=UPI00117BD5B4|nr:hypothetical protein [Levilactobacillus enshiensis]